MDSLKASLTSAPILVAPKRGESLLFYTVTSNHIMSATLVVEREERGHPLKVQRSVYFVDETNPLDRPNQVELPKPTITVYVDDIVVKMAQACYLIANLSATFANL